MIWLLAFCVFLVFLAAAPVLGLPLLLTVIALWVWARYRQLRNRRSASGTPVVVVQVRTRRGVGGYVHRIWHALPWNWFH